MRLASRVEKVGDVTDGRRSLMHACLTSLRRFHLPEPGMLAGVASWNGHTWTTSGPNPENTANTLIALYELRRYGPPTPIDPGPMMDRMMRDYFHDLDYTTIAFLLWADSVGDRCYAPMLWNALRARMPANVSQTMQLGWALTALSHFVTVAKDSAPVTRLAHEVYRRIAANQSTKTGLFFASGTRQGWLRRRPLLSSLSSQAYAIHGLARYGRIFDVPDAIEQAERTAAAICRHQGPRGQWWWRYNVDTGAVAEKYPVYSVNQDTAMPAALAELQRARNTQTYSAAIGKGVRWVFGENELGRSLVDEQDGVIWRAIRPQQDAFEVVSEMHSYHAARCLYSLCTSQAD